MVSVRTFGRPTQYRIQIIFAAELQVSNVGPCVGVQPEVKSTRWFQPGRSDPASLSGETAQGGKRVADEKLCVESKSLSLEAWVVTAQTFTVLGYAIICR